MTLRRNFLAFLKWGGYAVLFLLLYAVERTPGLVPSICGAKPMLGVPLLVTVAMFEGEMAGGFYGALVGLLLDYGGQRPDGIGAMFFLVCGCACGLLVRNLIRNNVFSAMLLSAGVLFLYGLVDWLLFYALWDIAFALEYLKSNLLGVWLYTFLTTPVIYILYNVTIGKFKRRKRKNGYAAEA